MGVEYCRWLVAREGAPLPPAARFARLVAALRDNRFVPTADSEALHLLDEISIGAVTGQVRKIPACRAHNAPARTVFREMPGEVTDEALAVAGAFVLCWRISASWTGRGEVGWLRYPLSSMSELDEHYYDLTVFSRGPRDEARTSSCSCDPQALELGWLGGAEEPPFGLVIDCGKDFDDGVDGGPPLRPELAAITRAALGVELIESGHFY